jgi:hypothetical protein
LVRPSAKRNCSDISPLIPQILTDYKIKTVKKSVKSVKSVARFFLFGIKKRQSYNLVRASAKRKTSDILPQIPQILTDYKIKTVKKSVKSVKSVARFFFLVLTKGSHTIW